MSKSIILGPLLGFEGDNLYTLCIVAKKNVAQPFLHVGSSKHPFTLCSPTPSGNFWRSELSLPPADNGTRVTYSIQDGPTQLSNASKSSWSFYVPGESEPPRIAYASCNGFSDPKLVQNEKEPLALWRRLAKEHEEQPFSLLLMGGDQLYADSLWKSRQAPLTRKWADKNRRDQLKHKAGPNMRKELKKFYEELYVDQWSYEYMIDLMASIPTCMMWDDHDIFDGWGSYSDEMLGCEVYQAIYETARAYFELFQIRSKSNRSLLSKNEDHYAWGFQFRDYLILALDNRAERKQNQIMSQDQWLAVKSWIEKTEPAKKNKVVNLIILIAVPVLYRRFVGASNLLNWTEWLRRDDIRDSVEDDVRDHWSHKDHEQERLKLLHNLFKLIDRQNSDGGRCRSIILSGDVHVGATGLIRDTHAGLDLHQIISSGIRHPPPSYLQWQGILATSNDKPYTLDGRFHLEMGKPAGGPQYMRQRNCTTIEVGTDQKLWINWLCEEGDKPVLVIPEPKKRATIPA